MTSPSPDLSPSATAKLQGYRAEIDAIDDKLIALFKQRIGIVSRVGKMKREQTELRCFIRSGREAEMLRRIYREFEGGDFHPAAAAGIWRLLIGASTHHEAPMTLAIAGGDPDLRWVAAEYFGSFMPQRVFAQCEDALKLAASEPATIAILPTDPTLWIETLAKPAYAALKIFALLPFLPTARADIPHAYAVAQLLPEATGEDTSLFACCDGAGNYRLAAIAGFHTEPPLDSAANTVHSQWLGTYANPIEDQRGS